MVAYHESARHELVARLERRDTAMFLYLAAVATVFGVVVNSYEERAPLLIAIPFLSLGAAYVHAQHNTVVGALGVYLGVELHRYTQMTLSPASVPSSWDASDTLAKLRGHIGRRFSSSLVILIGPAVAASTALLIEERPGGRGVLVCAAAIAPTLLALWSLLTSELSRRHFRSTISARGPAS